MRTGSALSLVFHLAIVLLLLFGLPDLFASDQMVIEPVAVQLATVADLATAPKPVDTPKPVGKPADAPPAGPRVPALPARTDAADPAPGGPGAAAPGADADPAAGPARHGQAPQTLPDLPRRRVIRTRPPRTSPAGEPRPCSAA
jgi:hypothetical protein